MIILYATISQFPCTTPSPQTLELLGDLLQSNSLLGELDAIQLFGIADICQDPDDTIPSSVELSLQLVASELVLDGGSLSRSLCCSFLPFLGAIIGGRFALAGLLLVLWQSLLDG